MRKLIVGIDEVGRGPLAGPVSVGIVLLKRHVYIEGLNDSKLLTEAQRERIYETAGDLATEDALRFSVHSVSPAVIDMIGIEAALSKAITEGLRRVAPDPSRVEVVLDGRLAAPSEYRQQSLIHGDALVPAISLASVVAKVERDRYMAGAAHRRYPQYGFHTHKGYGTRAHYAAIKTHGLSPLHRRSFLKEIVVASAHV